MAEFVKLDDTKKEIILKHYKIRKHEMEQFRKGVAIIDE